MATPLLNGSQQLSNATSTTRITKSRAQDHVFDAPRFVDPLENGQHVHEGDSVSFSTNVVPSNDPSLNVEWFKDNQPINAGARIHATLERGCAMLDILEAMPEDQGEYYCVVQSRSGTDKTAPVVLQVTAGATVIHDSAPDYGSFTHIPYDRPTFRHEVDPSGGRPPNIIEPLQPNQITINENDSVHLETKVEPFTDPYLTVDWFKNGLPLSVGSRFSVIFDRGHASMDILYAYPEDSGIYYFIAKNNNGQAQSNKVEVKCIPEDTIITTSSLPVESVAYLNSLDAPGDVAAKYEDFRYREFQELEEAPVFDILPETQTVPENGPAKFLVKVRAFPRPRVLWLINDNVITSTSSYRIYHDGSINYLEFYRCKYAENTKISVLARNKLGEATADAELIVIPASDYRPELKHIRPENPFKRLQALKKIETTPELDNAFRKPKAHVTQMRKIERDSELRAKVNKPEVTDAENLYMNIQSHLRRSDGIVMAELMQAKQQQNYEKQLQMEYIQKLRENEENVGQKNVTQVADNSTEPTGQPTN